MKRFFIISILAFVSFWGMESKSYAQITNIGDTLSISSGSFIYVPGSLDMVDSAGKYPSIINNGTLKISGSFIKSQHSIYNGGTDSLVLTGKDSQLFPGFSYNRFLADSGGNKYPDGNPEIRNAMLLKRKSIIISGNDTVIIDSAANLSENDSSYVLGNSRYSKYMKEGFYYQNGGIGFETVSDSTNPDNMIIFRKTGISSIQNGFCSKGTEKYFQVTSQNKNRPGATIVFHYFPHELNGIKKKNLWLFQSPDSGKTWYRVDSLFNDTFANTITCQPGKPFERYTLGDSTNPLVNVVKAGVPKSLCVGETIQIGGTQVGNHLYSWTSNPPGFVSSVSNPKVSPTKTTTYYLKEIVPVSLCTNTDSVTITVNPGPNTGWKITSTCPEYTFQANDTSFKNYIWDFGDGKNGTGGIVNHGFAHDSIYKIRLVVSDTSGCTGELDSSAYFNINNLDLKIYPNPFLANSNIQFNLCNSSMVILDISDVNGKVLSTIVNGILPDGFHQYNIDFSSHNWRDEAYFVRLKVGGKTIVNKIIRAG